MPKLHFIDTGLACHLLKIRNIEQLINSHYYGGMLENFMVMELTKQSSWCAEMIQIYHYRNRAQREVDIVLERDNNKLIGIEVKASATVEERDFRNLITLAKESQDSFEQGVVLYTGLRLLPFKFGRYQFYAIPIGMFLSA